MEVEGVSWMFIRHNRTKEYRMITESDWNDIVKNGGDVKKIFRNAYSFDPNTSMNDLIELMKEIENENV